MDKGEKFVGYTINTRFKIYNSNGNTNSNSNTTIE